MQGDRENMYVKQIGSVLVVGSGLDVDASAALGAVSSGPGVFRERNDKKSKKSSKTASPSGSESGAKEVKAVKVSAKASAAPPAPDAEAPTPANREQVSAQTPVSVAP